MSEQTAFKLKGTVPTDPSGIQTRRPDGTHRVVITGMGAISPAGVGVEALWDAVYGKKCCIDTIQRFDTDEYEVHIAGEVRDFDPTEHGLSKKEARRFERFVQYAIVASRWPASTWSRRIPRASPWCSARASAASTSCKAASPR